MSAVSRRPSNDGKRRSNTSGSAAPSASAGAGWRYSGSQTRPPGPRRARRRPRQRRDSQRHDLACAGSERRRPSVTLYHVRPRRACARHDAHAQPTLTPRRRRCDTVGVDAGGGGGGGCKASSRMTRLRRIASIDVPQSRSCATSGASPTRRSTRCAEYNPHIAAAREGGPRAVPPRRTSSVVPASRMAPSSSRTTTRQPRRPRLPRAAADDGSHQARSSTCATRRPPRLLLNRAWHASRAVEGRVRVRGSSLSNCSSLDSRSSSSTPRNLVAWSNCAFGAVDGGAPRISRSKEGAPDDR